MAVGVEAPGDVNNDTIRTTAVGVDLRAANTCWRWGEGATENAEAAKDLLQHLVEHGIDPTGRRLFVIDGSKALRTAINAVFSA